MPDAFKISGSGWSSVEDAIERKETKERRSYTGRVTGEAVPIRQSAGLDSYLCYLSCLLFNGIYRSVRLLDDEALLAYSAYIDLNPIL